MRSSVNSLKQIDMKWLTMAIGLAMILGVTGVAKAVTVQADAWKAYPAGSATVTQPSAGVADVKFASGFSSPASAVLEPSSTDPNTLFAGDYAAAKVNSMSLTMNIVSGTRIPSGTHVKLFCGGEIWAASNVKAVMGQPTLNRISMDRVAGGWGLWPNSGSLDAETLNAKWTEDLHEVSGIQLFVPKAGDAAQQFTISDFTLDSERAIQSLTPLESALLARFGVTTAAEVSAANAAVDSDGDGMTDLEKILVENDPGYFKKNFKAELDESDASGITIRWKCVQGYTYTVVRDTSMFGTFGEAIFTATASQTGVMSYKDVDAASEVQYFYKVIQN